MKKNFFKQISFLLLFSVATITNCENIHVRSWNPNSIYSCDKALFVGTINFPQILKRVPQISVYRGGIKINTETDNANKNIQFTISDDKSCKTFYILVTEEILTHVENNTVKYLKIAPNQNYKFYRVSIVRKKDKIDAAPALTTSERGEFCNWEIQECKLSADGRIPDDALLLIFNSECIEKVEGGTDLQLPRIFIKQTILDLFEGSEEKLHEKEAELLMSSLDLNIIHTKLTPEVKHDHQRKLVIAMANPEG